MPCHDGYFSLFACCCWLLSIAGLRPLMSFQVAATQLIFYKHSAERAAPNAALLPVVAACRMLLATCRLPRNQQNNIVPLLTAVQPAPVSSDAESRCVPWFLIAVSPASLSLPVWSCQCSRSSTHAGEYFEIDLCMRKITYSQHY